MGLLTFGPPPDIVFELANITGSKIFIETGTFKGNTTRWASVNFESVFTVERSSALHDEHKESLLELGNVKPILGDTRKALPDILRGLDENATIWLDAHWCAQGSAGESDECPLLEELDCLVNRSEDIILIDDARLFLAAPPLPHKASEWPTILDIMEVVSSFVKKPFVQIVDDVIFIVPDENEIKNALLSYSQNRSQEFWSMMAKLNREKV